MYILSRQGHFTSLARSSAFKVLQLFMASSIGRGKVLCLEKCSLWLGMLFIEIEYSSLGTEVMLRLCRSAVRGDLCCFKHPCSTQAV